ncbi:Uncharacterised protein g6905 [Pycnogonum litorale]
MRTRPDRILLPILVNVIFNLCEINFVDSAEVIIQVPFEVSANSDGIYRLDYSPTEGNPPANHTFHPSIIASGIIITNARPGTKYNFRLHYSNATVADQLTWTAVISTTPDQPIDLKAHIQSGQVVEVRWKPPLLGQVDGYKLKVIPKFQSDNSVRNVHMKKFASPFALRDLVPGGRYQINLYSIFDDKESLTFVSRNFTTKPNTPGRFIVWFRNETTLLVLWQPPYPSGIFSRYKVSINPPDALQSVILVEKEGEPPGPAQAAFNGLVPGRAYNISVETVSNDKSSTPTVAQYRTIPLPPENVTFDRQTVESDRFTVKWLPPKSLTEFDRYQVSIGIRRISPQTVAKDAPSRVATFDFGLLPGRTYKVIVKTMSGNVQSWPAAGNVTTRPLPVASLTGKQISSDMLELNWSPDNRSHQEYYKVTYREMDLFTGDSSVFVVRDKRFTLEQLLPGRNYSISVIAVSRDVESKPATIFQSTIPASPVIELIEPMEGKLNVSWKSDVTSRQDSFEVVYARNDTGQIKKKTIFKNSIILKDLYPGALYNVQVYAVSHGIRSEPITQYQAVFPEPPKSLTIVSITNSSMIVTWNPPSNSKYSHYVVRHRLADRGNWTKFEARNVTTYIIPKLVTGERYIVQVKTVSYRVESARSQQVEQTVEPSRITEVRHILDSYNITFKWTVPEGRIDYYLIVYNVAHNPSNQTTRHITSNKTSGQTMSVIVGELKPGELYSFRFYTISHGVRSNGISIQPRTMPVIDSYVNIIINQQERDTLGIRYTRTSTKLVVFNRYRFQLSDPSILAQEKLANDTNRLILFNNLTPGKLYNISIWTVSGSIHSFPISRQVRLYPEPVKKINGVSVTNNAITLAWNTPPGDKDGYEIQYLTAENDLETNFTDVETMQFVDLRPHWNYTFTVTVISGRGTATQSYSLPYSETFPTLESVPGRVQIFEPINVKPTDITFRWQLPHREQNGVLTSYIISFSIVGSQGTQEKIFSPTQHDGTINNLIPGKTYTFKIQANTKVGKGYAAYYNHTMPIWSPPAPSRLVYPTEVSHTTTTIRVRFRKNYFSNAHGPIVAFTIIVAETESEDSSASNLPSWQKIQDDAIWPPYQVNEPYYPFNKSLVEDFLIGSEPCDESSEGYCNGQLKPGSEYRVKVRAYTAPDKHTDTVYSEKIKTDPDNTPIIVGVIVPIIILIIVVVVAIILRRRSMGPFMKKVSDSRIKDDVLTIHAAEIETSRPVKLKDFAEHYRIMAADSDFRFSEEFEDLKHVGRDQACNAADLPVNRPKNRFTNILPYDHSRVKLLPTDDEEGSDYINANYMSGYISPREFIVTQGPLHSTRDDFWRMVWEQNSRAIVMLTRCVEKGREKCDHYWPYDTQPVYYGDIQVTTLNESQYQDWTVTEFKLMRGDTSRVLRHYHFTTWPDFGVPEPPQKLVKFVRAFRDRIGTDQKPIVTHCSAGVGRSGTFIVLDRLLQHVLKYDCVDIYGMVYEMRKDRVWMVQTEQQYICIHQCLLCVLNNQEGESPHPEVHDNQGFEDDEGIAESGM